MPPIMIDRLLKGKIVREQGILLGVILLLFVVFGFQVLLGPAWYIGLMTVPGEITATWRSLIAGDLAETNPIRFATLFTSALLHGGVDHIFLNAVFLWIFAALTVEILGNRWMLAIFVISAIAGSIGHTILNPDDFIPMLGASGAVMGFMGAYLGMAVRWQLPDPHIWPMARPIPPANLAILGVVGVALDLMGIVGQERTGIAYGAHVGGFLAGLFVTSFVASRPRNIRYG